MQRSRVWYKWLQPPLGQVVLCCSLKSNCAGGQGVGSGKWHHCTILFSGRGTHFCHSSRSPHRKAHSLPSCVPGFCHIPALNLNEMPNTTILLLFISGMQLGFKTLNLKGPSKVQILPSSSFPALYLVSFCHRKAVKWLHMCLASMMKHNKKSVTGLSALCMPLFSQWHPPGPLFVERQYTLFQMYCRKGNVLSYCGPGHLHTMVCTVHSWASALPLLRITIAHLPWIQQMAQTSKTSGLGAPLWLSELSIQVLIWAPVIILGL